MTFWGVKILSPDSMLGAYLFRESDVKTGLFIILHVKNSSLSHLVTGDSKQEWKVC